MFECNNYIMRLKERGNFETRTYMLSEIHGE